MTPFATTSNPIAVPKNRDADTSDGQKSLNISIFIADQTLQSVTRFKRLFLINKKNNYSDIFEANNSAISKFLGFVVELYLKIGVSELKSIHYDAEFQHPFP